MSATPWLPSGLCRLRDTGAAALCDGPAACFAVLAAGGDERVCSKSFTRGDIAACYANARAAAFAPWAARVAAQQRAIKN